MICPFLIRGIGLGSNKFLNLTDFRVKKIPIRYKMTKEVMVIKDPRNPKLSSDKGWAIIFPIEIAIIKSSKPNWEMDRWPITLATIMRKKKAMIALKIHCKAVSDS